MKIKSNLLRAAQVVQARDDIRYYLRGIHIAGKHVEASNGHTAVRMTMDRAVKGDHIIKLNGRVPKKAHYSKLLLKGKEPTVKHYDFYDQLMSIHTVEIIDGRFPDLNRVMKTDTKSVKSIGLDAGYISMFNDMFKTKGGVKAKFTFNGENEAVIITPGSEITQIEYGYPVYVVMPVRLGKIK